MRVWHAYKPAKSTSSNYMSSSGLITPSKGGQPGDAAAAGASDGSPRKKEVAAVTDEDGEAAPQGQQWDFEGIDEHILSKLKVSEFVWLCCCTEI